METLIVIGLIVGLIWYFSSRKGGGTQQSDKYYVVEEKRTHIVKVPGKKNRR